MKEFWKSKTFWFGALQLAVAVGQYAQNEIANGAALTVMGVLTVVLRFLTNEEVGVNKQ